MSFEITFVIFLLLVAFFLFATDYVSFDIAALILLFSLLATGILTLDEGLSGVSHPATVTIGCMFILSEGLRRTGILNKAGDFFSKRLQQNFWFWMLVMMLFISLMSSIMNNTAVVIIFIPILIRVADDLGISASKLLMPVSFAAIMGGICTLIGTSTNILVASIAESQGVASFSIFDFTPVGLGLLVTGYLFLFVVGIKMIPPRRKEKEELTEEYEMGNYLTDLVVEPGSNLIGNTLDEDALTEQFDLDVLRIFKSDRNQSAQRSNVKIQSGDTLRFRGSAAEIDKLLNREDLIPLAAHNWFDVDLRHGRDALIEAVVSPESTLEGKSLDELNFYQNYGAVPLAIRHHGELKHEELNKIKLDGGDSLLLSLSSDRIAEIENNPAFVIASEVDVMRQRSNKTFIALSILLSVVGVGALELLPIAVSAGGGVILMILTGCLSTEEAYNAVNWRIIMLLAGVIPMGIAMDKTGAAGLMAQTLVDQLAAWGPHALLGGFYLLTMLLSAIISTNASAALVAPLAIEIAQAIGVNPEPFIISVSYAASLTFLTPFGHHANTLIYGAGQYRFTDFTKVGLPINLLFWALAVFLIPTIWPF